MEHKYAELGNIVDDLYEKIEALDDYITENKFYTLRSNVDAIEKQLNDLSKKILTGGL